MKKYILFLFISIILVSCDIKEAAEIIVFYAGIEGAPIQPSKKIIDEAL